MTDLTATQRRKSPATMRLPGKDGGRTWTDILYRMWTSGLTARIMKSVTLGIERSGRTELPQ
jgi:hypothetical protein